MVSLARFHLFHAILCFHQSISPVGSAIISVPALPAFSSKVCFNFLLLKSLLYHSKGNFDNTIRGLTNSFSIFESHYTTLFPSLTHSTLSWPGSLQLFLTLFIGAFTSRYLDAGYLRPVVAIGIAFEVAGMLATSFCREFWQLVLAQGVVVGVGSGMLAFTSAAVVPFWWVRWRMGVAGLVSTGSSVGKCGSCY